MNLKYVTQYVTADINIEQQGCEDILNRWCFANKTIVMESNNAGLRSLTKMEHCRVAWHDGL